MADKPKNSIDEEAIIRRRDGAADAATHGASDALDADSRRALADARLRALAFALGPQERHPAREPAGHDDADLLAYLLDTIPADRRATLEDTLRGDAPAFERLVALRTALGSAADARDRGQADHPARNILRREIGRIDVRRWGEALRFKDAGAAFSQDRQVERLAESAMPFALSDDAVSFREMRAPRLQERRAARSMLGDMLDETIRDLATARNIVDEVRLLLGRWEKLRRELLGKSSDEPTTPGSGPDETSAIERRLLALLDGTRLISHASVRAVVDDAIAAAVDHVEPWADAQRPRSLQPATEMLSAIRTSLQAPESGPRGWSETIEVTAGSWALQLSGTALPAAQLAVTLRGTDASAVSEQPMLTLIRPNESFETASLDSDGQAELALPEGESLLLVQGDEVWELRLSYRARP